jgi:hypothetical protein
MPPAGWLAVAAVGWLAACSADAGELRAGPSLEARWTGSEAAGFQARADAEWCDSLNLLEIVAMAGDTGIAIAIYPRESLATGAYPVRPPGAADSTPPSSAIGLRWFSQTAVRGFQSDSGTLALTRATDSTMSGRFKAAAHPVTGKGPVSITGSFAGVRQRPATRGCSTAPVTPARPDTG